MGLFSLMAEKDGIAKKVDELASIAGADPALLSGLLGTPDQRGLQVSERY